MAAGGPTSKSSGAIVHWLRRGLRLRDNPALLHAVSLANRHRLPLLHLYVLRHPPPSSNILRTHFLLETLSALDTTLRTRGSRLCLVLTPDPEASVVCKVVEHLHAGHIVYERETAADAQVRDAAVVEALPGYCEAVQVDGGHTLYDIDDLLEVAGGKAPTTMQHFLSVLQDCGEPPEPQDAPSEMPPSVEDIGVPVHPSVPAMAELGLSLDGYRPRYAGGEEPAQRRLEEFLSREKGKIAAAFEKPNTSPAEFEDGKQETTALSPYLALGAMSPRTLYHAVRAVQKRHKKVSAPPVSLIGQVLWREHFHLMAATVPNFEVMRGNSLCRQIPWDNDDEATERWKKWEAAETGYPWIDALMMQLRKEGFVHHLGRHSLACFLTRGDLWVSWERGKETFERYLVDWDEALNAGNWMWLSASAFFSAYFRVYSPVAFAKRWSAAPKFIRHYLPVLAKVPDKYIFEPWKMPPDIARKAGVFLGTNYPRPMVEHAPVSKENIGRMAEAYKSSSKTDAPGSKRKNAGRSSGKTYKMRK
eukprot:CAMPEP_0198327714 /NCGR_PEP_ID=MMETSP1450-20131203/14915_1 /TAXON_ID=753684 ORGANISM="Madagascaria erythrocladiodes, Strain CCMP3234" /NCGR_SAMPLE_ID=MMETSP1450 /ASSEMBLY_ACC=CAM_ASM_001115 /LENGTH=531 /DNA_ID=CAMNT_0044031781 /DNA_START=43 /DNA_END=1638 /DNA_ORIENTATION=-